MKWIVWLLVIVNVLLLAYFDLDLSTTTPAPASHQPIQPEKLKLLTPEEIEALPKKESEAKAIEAVAYVAPTVACYEWGSFSATNLRRARSVLDKYSLTAAIRQQTSQESTRYWVYIPRLKSAEAAQAKAEELRALGIEDIFVVQEPQWHNAISFGVFKDEQLAAKLLEELKSKGVVTAVKGVRNQEKGQASLFISTMSSDTAAEIEKLKPDFPGSELKQATCQ
jgi:sporulation related protein